MALLWYKSLIVMAVKVITSLVFSFTIRLSYLKDEEDFGEIDIDDCGLAEEDAEVEEDVEEEGEEGVERTEEQEEQHAATLAREGIHFWGYMATLHLSLTI